MNKFLLSSILFIFFFSSLLAQEPLSDNPNSILSVVTLDKMVVQVLFTNGSIIYKINSKTGNYDYLRESKDDFHFFEIDFRTKKMYNGLGKYFKVKESILDKKANTVTVKIEDTVSNFDIVLPMNFGNSFNNEFYYYYPEYQQKCIPNTPIIKWVRM